MDRRAAGALLALAACFACSAAAPTASNQTALDLYEGAAEGCYYNFQHYGEGDRIMTNEPCLNCTCHNRMLMCYLRVCPFTKAIGQDCTVEKRADQCCPIVTCPDVPVDLLTSTSTTSPAEYGATGLGKLDKFGCSISGKYFPEGSKVPPTPNKPCEHCYCIRNMTTCVMQECTLHVDGCTPIYHKDVCCPVRYSCDHPEDEVPLLDDMSTTVRPTPGFLLTTTTISPVTQMTQDCVHDDRVFSDGALIKTEKACEHCYCMKGDIVCVVQECGAPMENEGKNCSSLPPREGQCCPDTYICEGDELPSDLPTESTTESIIEKLTTLSPPRRTSVEGSGYRNEPDEAPYTDMPIAEPEVEGSGDEEETSKPLGPDGIIPTPGDDDQYIYVTTKGPAYEDHEKTTVAFDKIVIPDMNDKTVEPPVSTNAPISEEIEKLTTSKTIEEDILEPHKEVSATMAPEIYESATTELGDLQNTVPDVIPDEEIAKPHGTTNAPTSESVSLSLSEGEDDKLTTSQKEQDVTSSPTSKPEYSTTSSSNLDEIEKETATPADISNITPEVMTEKEYSDGDITRTTSAISAEENLAADKETSKPELFAASTTISPDAEEKESSKPEEFVPGTTSSPAEEEKDNSKPEEFGPGSTSSPAEEEKDNSKPEEFAPYTTSSPAEEEKESSKPEEFAPYTTSSPAEEESSKPERVTSITTSSPLEKEEKLTTEPDHAQNTVAVAEEESTHPHSHIPTTTASPVVEEESTTVFNLEQGVATDKVIKEDVPSLTEHVTTAAPAVKDTEFTTAEPDRGLNTIPSEIYEETSSEPSLPGRRTTVSEETKGTEPTIITDEMQTQGVDIKSTSVSELTTPLPEGIVTKGDQFTVTTEPSFRKEDESIVSTEKIKEIEPTTVKSEFVDEGLIPTSSHDDKTGTSSDIPTTEEEFTTSVPEYITEIAETIGSKQTTTESPKGTAVVTEIVPEKVSEPSSEQDGDLPSSTEKLTEPTPLVETHEEPSRIPGEGDCLLNGVTYRNNTVVPSTNNCHTGCRCASSIIKCDPIICSPPPDYMDNCQSIYDSPDSCCPTFVCDHPRETVPPQSDNQMSGTESPMPSPTIECRGDQCEISEPTKQPIGPSEPCTSGSCLSADDHKYETECGSGGCGDVPQKPDTSIPSVEHTEKCPDGKCKPESCANGECQLPQTQVFPVTPCEGEHCEKTDEVVSESPQQCKNGEDCKPVEIPTIEATPCEGESCKKIDCGDGGCGPDVIASPPDHQLESCKEEDGCKTQDIPIPECTGDEPCRRKEVTTSDTKLPTPCEGPDCISEKETTIAQGAVDLSSELPNTEQTPSDEATEKIEPAEGEKSTELPDDHILKPVDEKTPVKDTQETDTYTTEGQTAEEVTGAEIQKEKPVIEGEVITKPTADEEKEADIPATVDEGDKKKPVLEEGITEKPTMIEKEGTETPGVIVEETTKLTMLGEEKPIVDEEKSTEEPTLIGDEGQDKPTVTEKESIESPTIDSEEGTKKPAIIDEDDKEKPVIDDESTKEPAIIDDDDKEKPAVVEETTKEPAIGDEEGKEKPAVVEETTKEPAIVDEEGKEKPVVDEETTKEPAIIDEDDKETPVFDKETTKEPAIVDEDGKEKPAVDEESTKEPAIIDEDDKEKPVIDKESTKEPAIVDEDGKEKPAVDEESTKEPAITDEDDKEKPVIDKESTKEPAIVDEDGKEKPVVDEESTKEPATVDEDGTEKPVVDEESTKEPATVDEDGTEKPVVDEESTKGPAIIDEDDKEKPVAVEEITKKPDLVGEEGTTKPLFSEEKATTLPVSGEKVTDVPAIIDQVSTDIPAVADMNTEKPSLSDGDSKDKPMDTEKDNTDKPTVAEDGTEEPIIVDEEGKPTDIDMKDTDKPVQEPIQEFASEKPALTDKDGTDKPAVEVETTENPDVIKEETTAKAVVTDQDKTEKPGYGEDEISKKPTDVEEKGTEEPAVATEDGDKKPTILKEDDKEKPDIIGEKGTEKPAVIDELDTEKPISEEDDKKPVVFEQKDTEKPNAVDKESTEKPLVEQDGKKEPAVVDQESTEKSVTSDDSKPEKSPEIEEEHKDKPLVAEAITVQPDFVDEDKNSEKPGVYEGTEEPAIVDKDMGKPTVIDEDDKEKPVVVEMESTKKPIDIESEGTELPVIDGEENTKKPDINDEEGIKKPVTEEDTMKPFIIEEESTGAPEITEEGGTAKPVIIDEGTEEPTIIEKEDSMKPAGIEKESTEVTPIGGEEGTEKPEIIDEETKRKPDMADQETTKTPAIVEEGTEKPGVLEEGTDEPLIFDIEGTDKPVSIDEEDKIKPPVGEDDTKKPILVGEKPVDDKEREKPLIIDEEVTDKPGENEALSTEGPKIHEVEGPGTEIPEAPHTSEPEDEVKSPELTVQTTDATTMEIEKTTKTPYSESQATVTEDVAHAYTTESNAEEPMDVSTATQETPETKVTEAEDGHSKEPVIHEHSHTPEITTESGSEQEITTKTSVPDHEKVTISEQDIEVTTFKVDTTDVKEESSTEGHDLISEEPALSTPAPESHKTSESDEKTTETGSISEHEEVPTDTSDIESPTTKAPGTGSVINEPQEGIEPGKPELHVTSKSEDESTTKVYEEDKIKPIPESHVTEASSTSSSDGVTDVSEITDEHKTESELPVHVTESDEKTTQVPLVEIKTDRSELHSSEKEETITETPEYSVTEPVRRFTEIEDPSVTGQEEIVTGYPEETTDHDGPSGTDKIEESGDVGITSSENPLITDMESEIPEKSSESDKPVTKMPEQGYQTPEAEKEKPTDEFEPPATEIPISVITESQQTSDVPEKDVTSYEEKTTVIPDLSEHKHKPTTPPEGYTKEQEPGTEIPQHHVTIMDDANKPTGPYVIEPYVTEPQETSTKSVEQEVKDTQTITTDIPITSEKGETGTTTPVIMYTESHDLDKKEPSITEIQKVSTDLPIEDVHTELPGIQISSEVPQSLVTEQKEGLGEQTTVSSIPKEESTYKPELLTTESEEISKAPEPHVPGQEEIQTEAPVLVTEPVDASKKEPEQDDKITHVSEDTVTEKQDTATTLRESPAVTEEIEQTEVMKSTEHTSAQTEFSETTPYLIELEEHTHKIVEDLTTVSPSEEEHSNKPVEDTSTSSPSEEEHSQKPVEDISTSSPSEEEHSYKPVEDISTSSPTKEEDLHKHEEDISTLSPYDEEHSHKPVDDISTPSPSEEEHAQKPLEDISTSSPPAEEYTAKIEEHVSTMSPLDEKPTTVQPEAGQEPQVSELTTKKTDEEIETATKEIDSTTKSSVEPLPESMSEKVSDLVPVDETTPTVAQGEDTKYTADHKEYTTAAPMQITDETTPVLLTESEKLPTSESDIAVPTEKEISTTEKPSYPIVPHETTAPEEEFILSTTKATTIRQGEDIVTAIPDDKFAKPEEKPSETSEVPPSSTTTEVSKPSIPDLQPTDELPVPDDDGQLPPSGTSGYGEPDYVEEDQAFGPGTCRYGGKVYVSAQQIPRDDPCDFCFCFRSDIICLQQSCPPPIHGCHEEPIQGFCCPRYECPVSMATTVNVTTTTTTTTTTLPPHFPTHSYKGAAQRRGCQIKGHTYKVGEVVRSSSGPCLHCTCGGDGQMKCDPKACTPEPMLRQMIAAAVSAKRRR